MFAVEKNVVPKYVNMEHLEDALDHLKEVKVSSEKGNRELKRAKAAIRRAKKAGGFFDHMGNHWGKYAAGTLGTAAAAAGGYYGYKNWDTIKDTDKWKKGWDGIQWSKAWSWIPGLSKEEAKKVAVKAATVAQEKKQEAEVKAASGDQKGAAKAAQKATEAAAVANAAADQSQDKQTREVVQAVVNDLVNQVEKRDSERVAQNFNRMGKTWAIDTDDDWGNDWTPIGATIRRKHKVEQRRRRRRVAKAGMPPRDPRTGRFLKRRRR